MTDLDSILATIAQMSPRDRERLWRRARQMRLLAEPASAPPATPPAILELPLSAPTAVARQPALPADEEAAPAPAPLHHVKLVFDGGSKGNPGQGYGSYAVHWNDKADPVQRLTFSARHTSNEAEYDTLIAALESILQRIERSQIDPDQVTLEIRGDSKLVISQVTGAWKAKNANMRQRRDRVRALLARFSSSQLRHQFRAASVETLGH